MAVQWLEIPTQPQEQSLRPYEFPGDQRAARLVRWAAVAFFVGIALFAIATRVPV